MPIREKLARRARKAGFALSDGLLEALATYFELLRKWNAKVSLTALPVEEVGDEAVDRLLIEPLAAVKYLPIPGPRLIDIGSGGGSPAIPLKLASPTVSLLMVESKTRKAAFLREVVRQLDLKDAAVDSVRVEELLTRPALNEAADVVSMRAVRADRRLLMAMQALLKPGGQLFLFRSVSGVGDSELVAPPFSWEASYPLVTALNSRLVVFRKRTHA